MIFHDFFVYVNFFKILLFRFNSFCWDLGDEEYGLLKQVLSLFLNWNLFFF